MMTIQYILGIDIGTSGTKAVAFTSGGQVLHTAYQPYEAISSGAGEHELDPAWLVEATIKTIKEIIDQAGSEGLLGLSFSCAMHSLIAVDAGGSPLTRAITWADLRSRTYAAKLRGTVRGKNIYEHTGTPIHPMSPLCKLMWLHDQKPEVIAKAHKFISIKEYIWFLFFGKYQVDYSIASATGLFDIYTLQWYEEALSAAGISPDHLSEPVPPTHIEKAIRPQYQAEMGLPDGIPFIIGGNDGCLANLGSNAVHPGEMALTIGTSGAVRMISSKPRHDSKERIFNYILTERLYVSGGPINNGGSAVKWWIDHFMEGAASEKDFSALIKAAGDLAHGSEGLICLPYLQGERAPVWDADAKGVFFGIHNGHGPAHFLRAIIEGVSFSLYQITLSLEETIGPVEKIYASGGFIQSEAWLQMLADIFDKNVYVTQAADASATGAAIIGFYALGIIDSLEKVKNMISIDQTYYPVKDRHSAYMKNFAVFAGLYDRLKDEFRV